MEMFKYFISQIGNVITFFVSRARLSHAPELLV